MSAVGFRFPNVSCSNCGRSFGPGDHGFSHCTQHRIHASGSLGFHARAVLVCQDTGSYCDAKNVETLNDALASGSDEGSTLNLLSDAIGDCAYRLREDGNELVNEGKTGFDRECGREYRDAAANLDVIVAEIEIAILTRRAAASTAVVAHLAEAA